MNVKRHTAFSLVEVIYVIVLIGIIASAFVIPRFISSRENAEGVCIKGTLGEVRSAIKIYRTNTMASGINTSNAWPTMKNLRGTAQPKVLNSPMLGKPWAYLNDNTINCVTGTFRPPQITGGLVG